MIRSGAKLSMFVVIAVAAGGGVATSETPTSPQTRQEITTRLYEASDLPVWRQTGNGEVVFDASLLVAHIQSTVSPKTWSEECIIREYEKNASLIVSQTRDNHNRVAKLLDSLRQKAKERTASPQSSP
ncbi:hypothetical protein KOR34_40470 [Posidoniimonas corsicana]|uniref:Uncharacterized protein n=1 Tax=Posidoniimonas corsicana TaxID=1938618 RepID=A0A5C5V3I3_9BACT|nr:hypothetical protein [Posidoniimonas corsicana]TWT32285.1 hypothetical protein KOR34_40470 [Posidoniimonas corsicana]